MSINLNHSLLKNSVWGIISTIVQNILLSVFFIIMVRNYNINEFGNYVIANTIYSFVLGFSSLGLGHWFIREYMNNKDRPALLNNFLKVQLMAGFGFYILNALIVIILYRDSLIRSMALIIGINIIFDNIIYVIKSLNIAEYKQNKTFVILTAEAFLKFMVACILFLTSINIIVLCIILIIMRMITLNMFLQLGSSKSISLQHLIHSKVNWNETRKIVYKNWAFIIISSLSVVNWRIGNIIISKYLTLRDVATYEVIFKLFSVAYLIPVMITSSLYPVLVSAFEENTETLKSIYKKSFILLHLYGLMAFSFTLSYVDFIVPYLFGDKFSAAVMFCKEMFLTILIIPTIFLQANILLALKLEKMDMICNVASLALNTILCITGLYFIKSLSVVNYAVFISMLAFHFVQDIVLIRKKITTALQVMGFYLTNLLFILIYYLLSRLIHKGYLFVGFWTIISLIYWNYYSRINRLLTERISIKAFLNKQNVWKS